MIQEKNGHFECVPKMWTCNRFRDVVRSWMELVQYVWGPSPKGSGPALSVLYEGNVFQTTAIHHPKYAHVRILRYSTAWPCSGQNGATTCNNYLLVLSIVSFSIWGFPSFSTSRRPGICFSSSHHVPSLLAISSHHLSMNFQCCSILLPFNSKKIWP
jgi:hypothetical protein